MTHLPLSPKESVADTSFKAKVMENGLAGTLEKWQKLVDAEIELLSDRFGPASSKLSEACQYSLASGGKRFRPAIVYMVAEAIGKGRNVNQAAMAVEMFHTASLIADDLPCMDDDDMRRGRPSLHRVFGESVALMASYALIAEGYALIGQNSAHMDGAGILLLALENAAKNTGANGATGGQYLDLFPPDLSESTVREVLNKKTVTLFELAFVLGWLFGGGDLNKLDGIKRAASHFGMAFQIADDLDDLKQDKREEGKANLALILGEAGAKKAFFDEAQGFREEMKSLGLDQSDLAEIIENLSQTGV